MERDPFEPYTKEELEAFRPVERNQLEAALEFLGKRAIPTTNVKDMWRHIAVIPKSEVEAVLKMVMDGTFIHWREEMSKKTGVKL